MKHTNVKNLLAVLLMTVFYVVVTISCGPKDNKTISANTSQDSIQLQPVIKLHTPEEIKRVFFEVMKNKYINPEKELEITEIKSENDGFRKWLMPYGCTSQLTDSIHKLYKLILQHPVDKDSLPKRHRYWEYCTKQSERWDSVYSKIYRYYEDEIVKLLGFNNEHQNIILHHVHYKVIKTDKKDMWKIVEPEGEDLIGDHCINHYDILAKKLNTFNKSGHEILWDGAIFGTNVAYDIIWSSNDYLNRFVSESYPNMQQCKAIFQKKHNHQ